MKTYSAKEFAKRPTPNRWGRWVYDPELMTLELDGYEIDLESIKSSAEILDWIFQCHGKSWITSQDFYDLASALRDLLHPQANYCSSGEDKRTSAKKLLQSQKANDLIATKR